MRLKALEEKYLLKTPIERCHSLVTDALTAVGLKNVTTKKQVPPRYLLVEYSPGWVGKAFEIEFLFKETPRGTEVSVKWPYTKEFPQENESPISFRKQQEETRRKVEHLIEDFKKRISATNISNT